MSISNHNRDRLNKMNRASQDVSLGTIIQTLQNTDTNLGTMAYQSGSNVYITGGSIVGVVISGSLSSANYANSSGSAAIAGSAGDYYAGGNIESNLLKAKKYHYSGVRNKPNIVDNGNGSVTVDNSGTYALYSGSTGDTPIEVYAISGSTFALQTDITTYIYVKYNSGSPIIAATLNRSDVVQNNLTTEIPIYTVYRYGSLVNIINWEDQSLALGEKLLLRAIDTDRFHRTSGLILGEYGTRNVSVTSGSVWYGSNQLDIPNFYSGSPNNGMYLIWYDGSIWSGSSMTTYDNTRYQGASGLSSVGSGKYVVNWIYKIVSSTQNYCVFVLGTSAYNQNQAIASTLPSSLPNIVQTQGILVGRIIVQSGTSVATQIDSAFNIEFTPSSLNHNDLSGLQGGISATSEYYHLSSAQYTNVASLTSVVSASANLTLDGTNYIVLASGSPTITLPDASLNSGRIYHIKNVGTQTITIATSGSQTIDGDLTKSISSKYSSLQIVAGNSVWNII